MELKFKVLKFLNDFGGEEDNLLGFNQIDYYFNVAENSLHGNFIDLSSLIKELLTDGLIYEKDNFFLGLTPKGKDLIDSL